MFFSKPPISVRQSQIFEEVALEISKNYPEIIWFADDTVDATSEAGLTSTSVVKSWTSHIFNAMTITDNNTDANKATINHNNKKYIELERSLHSILCFYLLLPDKCDQEAAYQYWIQAQTGSFILSKESFYELRSLCKQLTPVDIKVIEASLIYSDLGKTPIARENAKKIPEIKIESSDHDDFIDSLYSHDSSIIQQVLPSFKKLDPQVQQRIKEQHNIVPLHWGHVFHLEGGVNMFKRLLDRLSSYIPKTDIDTSTIESLIKHAFLIQVCDVAASRAHQDLNGFIAFNQISYLGYKAIWETITELYTGKIDPKQVLLTITNKKAKQLGYITATDDINITTTLSKEKLFTLTRLGAFLRLSNEEEGRSLLQQAETNTNTWEESDWKIVEEIFGLDSGINKWSCNPTYMPTVVGSLFNSTTNNVEKYRKALDGLLLLAKLLKKYQNDGKATLDSPLCFNSLAKQLQKATDSQLSWLFNIKTFDEALLHYTEKNEVEINFPKLSPKLSSTN